MRGTPALENQKGFTGAGAQDGRRGARDNGGKRARWEGKGLEKDPPASDHLIRLQTGVPYRPHSDLKQSFIKF